MMKLLKLLEENGKLTAEELAVMLGKETGDIKKMVDEYEKNGVILGYQAMVDWDKTDREFVSALIELKVTPQRDRGFDRVAEKIYNYPEVTSVYLMSGSFDLAIMIEGKTMKDVALFVAQKIAPMDAIVSTATHFVLCKYKDKGIIYGAKEIDQRGNSPV